MNIEEFFQDTLEMKIERLEKKNVENINNISRIMKHLKINDEVINEKLKTENTIEERIKFLEKKNIIIDKALIEKIKRL